MSNPIRRREDIISSDGSVTWKAWEFDYQGDTYYIRETEYGYSVVQLGGSLTGWEAINDRQARRVIARFQDTIISQQRASMR